MSATCNVFVLDLGWRNVSEMGYPAVGFHLSFQNERSGVSLSDLDLVSLSINIARRAANLADKYGITDARDLQSQMNLLDALKDDGGNGVMPEDIDRETHKVMKQFGCPRFGWKLKSRIEETSPLIRNHPEVFLQPPNVEDRQALSELAAVPDYLQLMSDQDGKLCLLDVAEIAMNIAEQLFRLEKSEAEGHKVPNDIFSWRILEDMSDAQHTNPLESRMSAAVPVATPEGEALMLIPEELIMNVASWVQATYLTAPVF
ncbi:hypothetical protein GNI_020120 [Gregarina niphandrodes]|uniref:Uncharacterized protein n=1 Tax=Gregarina niphandrodes TaxID=110365 RepID=A0A023BBT1_GRENI|nr:hypothetical protein GNI_020120 [Gregarina niphandrodes]EZG81120.1 hypothetical protein GNI_020120 [Gregarina niphandrodes]|eukprot:XP_011134267.1 hypothetical protein GNI_020120 [Gregarina niphandrodes]